MRFEVKWPEEADKLIRKLLGEGKKFAEIATALNSELGLSFSKNAVIGRAHRIGSRSDDTQVRHKRSAQPERKRRRLGAPSDLTPAAGAPRPDICDAAPEPAPTFEAPPRSQAEPGAWRLLDLEHNQCRYPFGEGPFTFCGCLVAGEGRSYCADHERVCRNTFYAVAA